MTRRQLQQKLEHAIRSEDPAAVGEAIKLGAKQNLLLPCGMLPMVLAVEMNSTGMIANLRGYPIDESQWQAASRAALGTELASMVAERHNPVPKPLGAT
ncbi:MAG: hypothetical protein WCG99_02155 [Candidatus Berkelbacteria bacterium]